MTLPVWYVEQVQDYLSIIRNSEQYTLKELMEATKAQRQREYALMMHGVLKPQESVESMCKTGFLLTHNLRQYTESDMKAGWLYPITNELKDKQRCVR